MSESTHVDVLSPTARRWAKILGVIGGALAAYVATALLVTVLTGDAIAGAAASDVLVLVLAIAFRWKSTGSPLAGPPQPRARSVGFWITVLVALIVCWLAGQVAAEWVYSTWGDPAFDAVNAAKSDSPFVLVFATALFLAPAGEEALIRGIAYPALRRQWPPLASAFVTATIFAVLHGNLVQVVLTVPVGILLAYVYEASQRLWPGVLAHFLFNAAASFVPARLVDGIAHPAMVAILGAAVVLLLFALTPGRYARSARDARDRASAGA